MTGRIEDHAPLDKGCLLHAFSLLGDHLSSRGEFVEIAVYGGSALLLQFDWRSTTRGVDVHVLEGYDERTLSPSVRHVADLLKLPVDWLNDAVGEFTAPGEDRSWFTLVGTYPSTNSPGLRVVAAEPRYLLAMKLAALREWEGGDRDFLDAMYLGRCAGVTSAEGMECLYRSFFGRRLPAEASIRLPGLLRAITP